MSIPFSERPGRHERQFRRRLDNPLFGERATQCTDEALLEVQRLDHEELLAFITHVRGVVQQAVDLAPTEESDVILKLKEQLDRAYEQSAGLADDQASYQAALAELIEVVMRNVERGAAGDPQAVDELAQERAARSAHFALLRHPLVADLLHPDSTIGSGDLAPTLLSTDSEELTAALQLFDLEQLSELHAEASRCLQAVDQPPPEAGTRLEQIAAYLAATRQHVALN
jgi:hypothetical protein